MCSLEFHNVPLLPPGGRGHAGRGLLQQADAVHAGSGAIQIGQQCQAMLAEGSLNTLPTARNNDAQTESRLQPLQALDQHDTF